jgi:adenylate kinase family enzyme
MRKKIKGPKVYASESVLREKKEEVKELESMLQGGQVDRGVSFRNDKIQEPELIKHQIAKAKRFIESNTPKKLKGEEANRAYKRAKELAAELKEAMPTQKLFSQRYPKSSDRASRATDFESAVRQQMEFQQKMGSKAIEYRSLMARLDPSNPMVRNIEALRRAR